MFSIKEEEIPKLACFITFCLGVLDIVRGLVHTIFLEYAGTTIMGLDLSVARDNQLILLGVFGISNFITGMFLILIALKARDLIPYILLLIPIIYFLGVRIISLTATPQAALGGAPMMIIYLTICFITSITTFILIYKIRRQPLRDIIMIDNHTKVTLVYPSLLSKKSSLPFQKFNFYRPLYFGSQGFMIFFDKSDYRGFMNIDKAFADGVNLLQENYSSCLYGIITDNDVITTEQGLAKAKELGIHYYETKPNRSMIELIRKIAFEWEDLYMENWLASRMKRFKTKILMND